MAGEYRWDVVSEIVQCSRLALINQLGGKCFVCGCTDKRFLEFHHLYGKDWRSSSIGPWRRMLKYKEEADQGLIVPLCIFCHLDPQEHPTECFCRRCREPQTCDFPN